MSTRPNIPWFTILVRTSGRYKDSKTKPTHTHTHPYFTHTASTTWKTDGSVDIACTLSVIKHDVSPVPVMKTLVKTSSFHFQSVLHCIKQWTIHAHKQRLICSILPAYSMQILLQSSVNLAILYITTKINLHKNKHALLLTRVNLLSTWRQATFQP